MKSFFPHPLSDLTYFILYENQLCGVNCGVSKQLLPSTNQLKSRFAIKVLKITVLGFFRFQFTRPETLKKQEEEEEEEQLGGMVVLLPPLSLKMTALHQPPYNQISPG